MFSEISALRGEDFRSEVEASAVWGRGDANYCSSGKLPGRRSAHDAVSMTFVARSRRPKTGANRCSLAFHMYGTVWLGLGCMLYAEDEWWVKRQWLGLRAGSLFGKLERVEQVERVEYESSVT
jgi:hypothetical protein